jgi:hypothetical protein
MIARCTLGREPSPTVRFRPSRHQLQCGQSRTFRASKPISCTNLGVIPSSSDKLGNSKIIKSHTNLKERCCPEVFTQRQKMLLFDVLRKSKLK